MRRPRVVTGASGTPGSATALRRALDEARGRDAELWAVLAWQAPGGGIGSPGHGPGTCMTTVCRDAAADRLRTLLAHLFGPAGPDVPLHAVVSRATPGAALVDLADGPDDLIVVGTGTRRALGRLRPSVAGYCRTRATCPVLTVPPSPLQADLDRLHRRNRWHLPVRVRDLAA